MKKERDGRLKSKESDHHSTWNPEESRFLDRPAFRIPP